MAVCGNNFTLVVDEDGEVWCFGEGYAGQLGLGNQEYQLIPARVGGREVFGERVDMVSTGFRHAAAVVADGSLYTWGLGRYGQLGHGNEVSQLRPKKLNKQLWGGLPAVQVACGYAHTVVLTKDSRLWTCGSGSRGQLGHGDKANKLDLSQVGEEHFKGKRIVMVAVGDEHNAAVGDDGSVFTWGSGDDGCLGHNDEDERLVPTKLTDEAMGGVMVVMVAAGSCHTVAVAQDGLLWVWGNGMYGQLGLGDDVNRLVPTRVQLETFGGSRVLMADCGDVHTLAVTEDGEVYSCGDGGGISSRRYHGQLGHTHRHFGLATRFTRIAAQHFGVAKIVSASAGHLHSSAVTEHGVMYTWGDRRAIGHGRGEDKWVPTLVPAHLLGGKRVGRYHKLLPELALAFAMGTHPRLGSHDKCICDTMPPELVQRVVEACQSWPEAQTGVRRLLGGGMLRVNHTA